MTLLFWLLFGVVGSISAYIGTVLSWNEVMALSDSRSIAPIGAVYFGLLYLVLECTPRPPPIAIYQYLLLASAPPPLLSALPAAAAAEFGLA